MVIKNLKIITVGALLAIFMMGCSNNIDSSVVATINGKDIKTEYFEKTLKLQKYAVESTYGLDIWEQEIEKGIKFKDGFKQQVLDQIISICSIYDEAEKENLLPTEEEVNEAYENIKLTMQSDKEYESKLEKIGITNEFIKYQQAQALAIENYKENFEETTEISDEESKKYYDNNKDEFKVEQIKASHILISTKDENDKELSKNEKENKKDEANKILERVRNGEEFSILAKENSSCPSSENGGDLGWFGKGQMVPEFEEAAFKLNLDEVSEIVETTFGYHIIKLADKKEDQIPFEQVRDYIKNEVKNDKFTEKIEQVTDSVDVEINEDVLSKAKI